VSTTEPPPSAQPEPRRWPLAPEPEPLFGLAEVGLVVLVAFVAVIVCGGLSIAVAHQLPSLRNVSAHDLALYPRVLLPAQLLSYLIVFALLRRYFSHLRIGILRALAWRWPEDWMRFVVAGVVLGVFLQFVSLWIPTPPELPIERMFRTPTDAWLMSAFGVLIAPFAEELFFRGLLFPAIVRHTGPLAALLLTSLAFGAVHSQQLGGAWSQVALLAFVGFVLTLVRWRYHSLAASTLLHVGYNGMMFAAVLVQTRGFTHLPLS
jgi:membrane protease YdiL (CAAX protease family)